MMQKLAKAAQLQAREEKQNSVNSYHLRKVADVSLLNLPHFSHYVILNRLPFKVHILWGPYFNKLILMILIYFSFW